MTPDILVMPGSTRAKSLNTRLAGAALKELARQDASVTLINLDDYPLPMFHGDVEGESGLPEPALQLARRFHKSDGVLLLSPEYNAGFSPLLKNTLDWISRVREDGTVPFKDRVFALASAAPGAYGGMRALLMLRQVLTSGLGALVIPEQVLVPHARQAFDEAGELIDEKARARLRDTVAAFLMRTRQIRRFSE